MNSRISHPSIIPTAMAGEEERGCQKFLRRAGDWFAYKDKKKWLEEMRGSLSLTASIIATMTFQLATNPPGGVLQAQYPFNATDLVCNRTNPPCPGEAVKGVIKQYKSIYRAFLVCNTISFVASLSVCLLLVSGIPLNWIPLAGMCITIISLALTYFLAALMVTPHAIWPWVISTFGIAHLVWIGLIGIVGVFLILRLIVRGLNKCSEEK